MPPPHANSLPARQPERPESDAWRIAYAADDTLRHEVLKWLLPMLYAMFGFYVQSACLHYATYAYVHKYALDPRAPPAHNEYATLADPVEDSLGPQRHMDIHAVDAVAALFPMLFLTLSVYFASRKVGTKLYARSMQLNTLQLWTKVMLCAGFLFIIKGIVGAVTTVPDSSGWNVCKDRLKPEGLRWMEQEHTFWSMLILDFRWNVLWHRHPLRYCADMMYSGHTFTVTLFALGLYELIRIARPPQQYQRLAVVEKMICLTMLVILSVGEQLIEISIVEETRFHYTSDVVTALVMTFLFYTNGAIAVSAKRWSQDGLKPLMALPAAARVYFYSRKVGDDWDAVQDDSEQAESPAVRLEREFKPSWRRLVSKADIFIPPCCVPFCCLAGREHIYSDRMVKDIVDAFVIGKQEELRPPLRTFLQREMNINEGVSVHDLKRTVLETFGWDLEASASEGSLPARNPAVEPWDALLERYDDMEARLAALETRYHCA